MSVENVPDLMDLFEYDEFDSYQEYAYRIISNSDLAEGGVPLSVELSESVNKTITSIDENSTIGFVKAPEIFLRIDSNVNPSETISEDSISNQSAKNDQQTNLIEIKYKNDINAFSTKDECIELQYENEFLDSNDSNDDWPERKANNNVDSEYEDLLLEGIKIKRKHRHLHIKFLVMSNCF